MKSKSEAALVKRIVTELTLRGACVIKVHGGPNMPRGEPDLIGSLRGAAFAVEVKLPGRQATKLQRHRLSAWARAGARAGVAHTVEEAVDIVTGQRSPLEENRT